MEKRTEHKRLIRQWNLTCCYKMPHVSHGNEVEKRKLIFNKKPAGLY